ncbi:hypothetical protein DICVIV_00987 [Dictyocaulus viviparus]|uniref:Uncharacterized protein n=1 Tax=Dictyocaulus viviparus TaxID=29172 RepID=A0A0D8Y7U4_DICVI|nr:hypothetical protein DICVIV_00987 [Dictyocaulus viviparus]
MARKDHGHSLYSDLEIIKEKDTNTSTKKRRRRIIPTNNKDFKSVEFWNEMHELQGQWIQKICTSAFPRCEAINYSEECWDFLTKVYSMFRNRPLELQQSIQLYICDAIKIVEFLTMRGCDEVSNSLSKFVLTVFRRYLKNRKNLNELNQGWVQSREIMRIVCQSPTVVDILLGLIAAINEIMLKSVLFFVDVKIRAEDDM